MTSTRYVTVDSVIRELCRDHGDDYCHRWFIFYSHAVQWLREMDYSRGGFKGIQYRWLPVVDGRVALPDDLTGISKVGIVVEGHIQPLIEDTNMVDRPDDCGALTRERPVNPDIPALRSNGESQLPGIGMGFGFGWNVGGYIPFVGYGWSSRGYYPGLNINKSLYGYYRIFERQGYMLLDADSTWEHIVIECASPSFTPGQVTKISEVAVQAMKAYIRWAINDLKADVATVARPIARERMFNRNLERAKLRQRLGAQPLYEIWASVKSS